MHSCHACACPWIDANRLIFPSLIREGDCACWGCALCWSVSQVCLTVYYRNVLRVFFLGILLPEATVEVDKLNVLRNMSKTQRWVWLIIHPKSNQIVKFLAAVWRKELHSDSISLMSRYEKVHSSLLGKCVMEIFIKMQERKWRIKQVTFFVSKNPPCHSAFSGMGYIHQQQVSVV